jgi:hypothetical protein
MASSGTTSGESGISDLMGLWSAWLPRGLPNNLVQPILPDWSLIRITENNSTAPDTERRILAQDSYGRQIGRMMDMIAALVERVPEAERVETAYAEFEELKKRVDAAKNEASSDRIGRMRDDIARLKASSDAADVALLAALRAALGD